MPNTDHSREIARRVLAYFRAHQRDLPWRKTRDPYRVWVSEIMLQQTRVATVVPFFERWLGRFPTVKALAESPLDDVLAAWSGLGYYTRARNLHRGAREVVASYGGSLPRTARELHRLPGIGRYTAGAIASQAFDEPAAVVDGNVARVLARLFALDVDVRSSAGKRELWSLADALVPAKSPGDYNQGLMELGATVCTPTRPGCDDCPLLDLCEARAQGRELELPTAAPRKTASELPLLKMAAAWIRRGRRVLLLRRAPAGLYGGLWELPQARTVAELPAILSSPIQVAAEKPATIHEQILTHRRLVIEVWPARLVGRLGKTLDTNYDKATWQPLDALERPEEWAATGKTPPGVSAATRAIIETHREQHRWKKTAKPTASSRRATRRSSKGSRR